MDIERLRNTRFSSGNHAIPSYAGLFFIIFLDQVEKWLIYTFSCMCFKPSFHVSHIKNDYSFY